MKIQHKHKGVDYILTNENLQVGDKVYPIGWGCAAESGYIHYKFEWKSSMSGFPNEPHIIEDRHYMNHKEGDPYEIRTNHGYGPSQQYYKIIFSIDKKDYEVRKYTRKALGKKAKNWILIYDKRTHSTVISICDGKVKTHMLLRDWLTKEEIEKIKTFCATPQPGIIQPSFFELTKILAS